MSRLRLRVSSVFLVSLAVSVILGLLGGSGFLYALPQRAWEIFTAAYLWVLIVSAGTLIGRFFYERVRRGNWWRGLWLAGVQSFPLTTVFLLAASAVAGATILSSALLVCYTSTLVIALSIGGLNVLTSPFIK